MLLSHCVSMYKQTSPTYFMEDAHYLPNLTGMWHISVIDIKYREMTQQTKIVRFFVRKMAMDTIFIAYSPR